MDKLLKNINETFVAAFGETPLQERLNDINREAGEVRRASTLKNLRTEMGQLLCSVLQGCNENEYDVPKLIEETLAEIQARNAQYKAFGRKIRVALLGGAFDPITTGHIQLAKYVLDYAKEFDEVWITPCFQHMYGKKMASPDHRLKMVRLACECDGRIKPFTYEIDNQLGGETYHFVKKLLVEPFAQRQYNFSYIIGQDNANSFDRWVNFEHLSKAIRFVVVPRKGYNSNPAIDQWLNNDFHIRMPDSESLPFVSSTLIREMLAEQKTPDPSEKYLDPKVYAYIQEQGLYNCKHETKMDS